MGPDLEKQMDQRLTELKGHELVDRKPIAMPQALVLEIERCEALIPNTRMNAAALRSVVNEAKDSLLKFQRLQKRVIRSFNTLKDFK